jgi:hypothetical protein
MRRSSYNRPRVTTSVEEKMTHTPMASVNVHQRRRRESAHITRPGHLKDYLKRKSASDKALLAERLWTSREYNPGCWLVSELMLRWKKAVWICWLIVAFASILA